jgi:hypothetical protein
MFNEMSNTPKTMSTRFFFPLSDYGRYSPFVIIGMFVFVASLFVVFAPEPSATLLTPQEGWLLNGDASSRVAASDVPLSVKEIPASVETNPESFVFRTWTPDHGVVPIDLVSPAFNGERFLRVLITGNNRTLADQTRVWLECQANGLHKEIFQGSVNNRLHTALVELPESWCSGEIVLRLHSDTRNPYVFVGAGSVFSASLMSYLKAGFLGKIPFMVVAALLLTLLMLSGGALSVRFGYDDLLFPAALAFLGIVALGNFYLVSALPRGGRWLGTVFVLGLIGLIWWKIGRDIWRQAWIGLRPHLVVWFLGAGIFIAFSALATNGLGAWEPNYRFWPAAWSSDNELPWTYAEAIRHGWNLKNLWGGWLPTDRPPLMAAAHLLYGDLFELMQFANDGHYLTSGYYNTASILLNSLWLPACHWMLRTFLPVLECRQRHVVLLFVALLPFSVFNTIYGWPKALGAAYALASFGLLAWKPETRNQKPWMLACVLAALSYLSHGSGAFFLAPMLFFYAVWRGRRDVSGLMQGCGILLVLLLTWSVYKALVLPSADPLIKVALTGDFGFNTAQSVFSLMKARYLELGLTGWLEVKKAIFTQLFIPVNHTTAAMGLNEDFGATTIDRWRAYDFLMLSRGNIALLIVVVFGLIEVCRRKQASGSVIFMALLVCSLTAWILVISVFLAPAVLHTLPFAAIFGAALSGSVLLASSRPVFFQVILLLLAGYMGTVWGVMPLVNALGSDPFAAAILALGSVFCWKFHVEHR